MIQYFLRELLTYKNRSRIKLSGEANIAQSYILLSKTVLSTYLIKTKEVLNLVH